MSRRVLAALFLIAGLAAAWEVACQPAPGLHRIAFISVGPAAPNAVNVAAFKAGLADLGYVLGKNIAIDFRWADQKAERLPGLVGELLSLNPRVIVSTGGPVTVSVVKAATTKVPVVFITGDPVGEKIVSNLARPGGNLTGMSVLAGELEAKRLEMLHQMIPRARRIAIIWNPTQPSVEPIFRDVEAAGKRLGLTLLPWKARNKDELEGAFREIPKAKPDALFVVADPVLGFERAMIVEFAAASRLPGIYFWREFAEIGGLASYGTNLPAIYRRAATHIDRILKGANPGDLPIEQPTTFELVVNLKTAKSLGIDIPNVVRQRADTIIE